MSGLKITQMPYRDHQGGEHQPDEPVNFYADNVENKPEPDAPDTPESVTSHADDVENKPVEGGVDREPQTHTADWPPAAENKVVKAEQADTKAEEAEPAAVSPEPVKKSTKKAAPAKRAAKKSGA
jgi:hypothetical protein